MVLPAPAAAPPVNVSCSNTAALTGSETLTATIPVTVSANTSETATRTFTNTATANLTLVTEAASDADTVTTVQAVQAPTNDLTKGLVHISATGAVEAMRDHNNDVIGYRHTVCALNDSVDAIWPNVIARCEQ